MLKEMEAFGFAAAAAAAAEYADWVAPPPPAPPLAPDKVTMLRKADDTAQITRPN